LNNLGVSSTWSSLTGVISGSSGGVGTSLDWGNAADAVTATLDYGNVADAVTASNDWGGI
jgi:hypothetical protein